LYMRPTKENTQDELGNLKHLVWNLEKAIAVSANHKMDKMCLLIDFEGYKLKDAPPMSTSRKTLDILQNHYPERMHRAYVCNPPFIFRAFWTLIRPFVDPVTKQKIVFLHGVKGMANILDDVGPDRAAKLEPCAGGAIPLRACDSKEYLSLPFGVSFDEK
jgi:hypothetical protein